MGMFLADQAKQVPRAIGQYNPMHVASLLHRIEHVVERVDRGCLGQRGENALGTLDIARVNCLLQCLSARLAGSERGGSDFVEDLTRTAAMLLNTVAVSIQHL